MLPGNVLRPLEEADAALGILCPSEGASCQGGCPDGLLAVGPLTEVDKRSLAAQIRCPHISVTLLRMHLNPFI